MNKNKIKLIFTIFTVLVILGLIGFFIYNGKHYLEAKDALAQKQTELNEVKSEIAEIKQAIAKYEDEKKEFEEFLFKEQDIPAFLDSISKKAKDTAVNVTDMKTKSFRAVQQQVMGGNVAQQRIRNNRRSAQQQQMLEEQELQNMLTLAAMPINMKIEGEFESLLQFFNSLEDIEQLITISNVEINTFNKYPQLSCKYTLKIYSLKTLSEIETR